MISFFSIRKKEASQYLFDRWLDNIVQHEDPSDEIIAYNFGIFESEKGYMLYLAGFSKYDQDDDDWSVGFGDFSPTKKYFTLPNREFKKLSWQEVLERVIMLIKNFIKRDSFKDSFLGRATVITTGFDDGDLVKIE